jgi:hypothetical protein
MLVYVVGYFEDGNVEGEPDLLDEVVANSPVADDALIAIVASRYSSDPDPAHLKKYRVIQEL